MAFTRVLGPGIHTASNINSHNINSTGIITAVSFVGNGAGLTGIASTDNIITGTAATFNTYPVDINAGMDVVGVSSFQDIDVDGHTNLDNVSIAGVTTATGAVTLSDNLNIAYNKRIRLNSVRTEIFDDNNLRIDTNGSIIIRKKTGYELMASLYPDAGVWLYYNGTKRFETTNTGAVVTGILTVSQDLDVDGHTNLDNVSVAGVTTFAGAIDANGDLDVDGHTELDNVNVAGVTTFNDNVHLKLNDRLYFGNSNELEIYQQGNNSFIKNNDDTFIIMQGGSATNYPMKIYGGNEFQLRHYHSNGGQNSVFTSVRGGAFTLYHAAPNTPSAEHVRLETTSTGLNFPRDIDVDGHTNLDNVSIAGVTTFSGGISGSTANLTGALTGTTANFSGNVTVGGVLTYEDVKNVDSIGIATARAGLNVSGGNVTIANDIDVDGHTNLDNLSVAGVSTFSDDVTFTGASYNLTWDKSDNRLKFAEFSGIRLGNNNELQIDHRGTSYILNIDSMPLVIGSNSLILTDASTTSNRINCAADGTVILYKSHSEKLRTKNYGIQVTGLTDTDSLLVSGISTLTGAITANGAIDLNADLDVDGHTNLDNVSVAGVSTFSDTVKVGAGITFDTIGDAEFCGIVTFHNRRGGQAAHFPNNEMAVFGNNYLYGNIRNTGSVLTFDALNTMSFNCWDGNSTEQWMRAYGPNGTITLGGYSMGASPQSSKIPRIQIQGNNHLLKMFSSDPNSTTLTERFSLSQSGINFTGLSTHTGNFDLDGDLDVDGHTNLDNVNVVGVVTASAGFRVPDGTFNTNLIGLGNHEDFIAYHDSAHTYLQNKVGDLRIQADALKITSRTGVENYIHANLNGAVEVYYDNSKKLETSEKGIKVGTGVTVETNGQATFTGIVTATSFKLANGSDVGTGAGGTWSTYTAGIATSKSVGVNTSTLDDNDLVGVGNSFQGLYISNGMIIHDNTLSGNHYIGTSFNGLMAGPVNIEGTLSVEGSYFVV